MRKAPAWISSDNRPWLTRLECQKAELSLLLNQQRNNTAFTPEQLDVILSLSKEVMAVLTLKESSRPGARGKKRPRTLPPAAPELPLDNSHNP